MCVCVCVCVREKERNMKDRSKTSKGLFLLDNTRHDKYMQKSFQFIPVNIHEGTVMTHIKGIDPYTSIIIVYSYKTLQLL